VDIGRSWTPAAAVAAAAVAAAAVAAAAVAAAAVAAAAVAAAAVAAAAVSRAKMVAGILRKVFFALTQPHARVSFPIENGRWHFEKSHFLSHSATLE
jgi:hypothetical protein